MQEFSSGDRVRIDIPDETNPDHEMYHGKHGEVLIVISDDTDDTIDEEVDQGIYRIELDTGETYDATRRDLRPPIDE